ncbi:phosphoglycerol transferase MdoB-like AlkP superfamily enzyme [Paenibacillus sp. DS2015]|uniref:LTA synthase family protein n=1 Tax=Paenibacillus sp. DS2015 TaxID=3373917 RepID=UPI003D236019
MNNIPKRFSLPSIVLTVLLLVAKLSLLRIFFFDQTNIAGVLKDTLSILVILCLLELILPRIVKRPTFWIFNAIFSFLLFAATLYQIHFGSVPAYSVLGEMGQVPQIRASITPLIKPYHFLFFADLLIAAIIGILHFSRRNRDFRIHSSGSSFGHTRRINYRSKIITILFLAVCMGLSALFINRGQAIDNEWAQAEDVGFLNFQVSTALRNKQESDAIANGNLQQTKAAVEKLQSTYPYNNNKSTTTSQPEFFASAEEMNVIVVQLESFQNFTINLKVDQQEATPVLNKLAKESYYFPYVYQQIGQGNTSDAEFMSNTSIYPTGSEAMSVGFGNRELPSLPRLLQKYNYQSATFHINSVDFWSRNLLYPGLAFDNYYDKPFYTNDHFNDFGASDEELYRVGLEKLTEISATDKPFYAQFVTTSSHAPFVVPDEFLQMKIPTDLQGSQLGNYLSAINYTDYALGQLIEQLKEQGLWDNTVFVAYGDHFGIQPKETDAAEITAKLGIPYDNQISRFNIPLFIHVPNQKGQVVELTGGQLDIMPTISNLLGISLKKEQFTAFGRDLLNTDNNVFGMRYYLPTGSFFNNDVMFVPGKGFEDGIATSLKTLQPVQDIIGYRDDYDYIRSLMKLSDDYVQLLPRRTP